MDKYLFTDGTNGVKEAFSSEELLSFISNAEDPDRSKVWVFGRNEWITAVDFFKQYPDKKDKGNNGQPAGLLPAPVKKRGRYAFIRQVSFVAALVAGALLIFNFTDSGWQKGELVKVYASRPANVPVMDADSLRREIEIQRGKSLDKSTANNLRLRNNWPEQMLLQVKADRETKRGMTRFLHVAISLDNATGYNVDEATVRLLVWNKGKQSVAGTFRFSDIRYAVPAEHIFSGVFKADSISAAFQSIRAKAFNFCYDAARDNPSGNYNDRWFCRDGKQND